jgi:hypothetical protein
VIASSPTDLGAEAANGTPTHLRLPAGVPVAAALVLGACFLIGRPQLTGWPVVDVVYLLLGTAALTVWLVHATWSSLVVSVCGLAVASGGAGVAVAIAVGFVAVVAVALASRRPDQAGLAGVLVFALVSVSGAWTTPDWSSGWWMAIAVLAVAIDAATARRARGSGAQRSARWALVGAGVIGLLALVSGVPAARDASRLQDSLGAAVDDARAGDVDAAVAGLDAGARQCAGIRDALGGVRGLGVRLVPGLGAHAENAAGLGATCHREVTRLAETATAVRATLTPDGQQYDLSALAAVPGDLTTVRSSLTVLADSVRTTLEGLPIPRVPAGVERRLDDLERADARLATLEPISAQLPRLFGADGVRRYFVMFVTPAEGRPLGGFMGNWAIVRANAGLVTVERSGRTPDLASFDYGGKSLTDLEDYRARYRGYFSGGLNEAIDPDIWSLFTVTPDLPTAGEAARQLAPQSNVGEIDGVVMMDVESLGRLLTVSGDLELPEFGVTLTSANASQMLLRDQYWLFDRVARVAFLLHVADQLTERLVGGDLGLTKVISTLRTPVEEGRVGAWMVRPEEQAAAEQAAVAPSFPEPEPTGFVVTSYNRSPNKLDSYLQRTITYEATVAADGTLTARGEVTLTNTFALDTPKPHTDAENSFGDPSGSIRQTVCMHSPHFFVDASEPIKNYEYLGWNEACVEYAVAPGQSVTFWTTMQDQVDPEQPTCFVSRGQVTGLADRFHAKVTGPDGVVVVDAQLDGPRARWELGPGCPPGA